MTDLSYTNKDGLNLYEGFDNGFNYHKDGKQDGDGYAHGGYPEITGETSDYPSSNYKTGDDPDFWGNGNVWEQPSVGPEPTHRWISASGIYKKCLGSSFTFLETIDTTKDMTITYVDSDYEEQPAANIYTARWIAWGDDRYVMGNTGLLEGWGYDEEPTGSEYPFCFVWGFMYDDGDNHSVLPILSSEFASNWKDGDSLQFKEAGTEDDPCTFYDLVNNIYSSVLDAVWDGRDLVGPEISDDDSDLLSGNNGKYITISIDGTNHRSLISCDYELIEFPYDDQGESSCRLEWLSSTSHLHIIGAYSNGAYHDPDIENNKAFSVAIDMDSISESK